MLSQCVNEVDLSDINDKKNRLRASDMIKEAKGKE